MQIQCVDDDLLFLKELKKRIINYSIQSNINIDVHALNNIPKEINDTVDAYILDVMIGEEKIFDYIKRIRKKNLIVPIIVVSNNDHFVFDSSKLNIFYFIRKRNIDKELQHALDNLLNYLSHIFPFITIKQNGEILKLKLRDICYVEAKSHETIIKTIYDEHFVYKDIKKVFEENMVHFIQVSKSYYINPAYVTSIKNNIVTIDNTKNIIIGRKYNKFIKDYITNKNL